MIRSIDKWLPGYIRSVLRRPRGVDRPMHLIFCVADHFEPFRQKQSPREARDGVREWLTGYSKMSDKFRDADGRVPQHTFFYPGEDYDAGCLELLSKFCAEGPAEVEIHLHHRNDTADSLRQKLVEFRDMLREQHGLLGVDAEGRTRYGFVHGNWALCNSRPDGDWCGVNDELAVLKDTGCYADFTFPSAPSPTQPRIVNSIYRTTGDPSRPRAHDTGDHLCVSRSGSSSVSRPPSSPILIQGPLALNWVRRKWGIFPRLENGAVTEDNPPSRQRIDLWVRQHIHVSRRPEWVFVKVHTHGYADENRSVILGAPMSLAHKHLCDNYNDGSRWRLHYVTAREMFNIARAAEDGETGNPGDYRNYEVSRPSACTEHL